MKNRTFGVDVIPDAICFFCSKVIKDPTYLMTANVRACVTCAEKQTEAEQKQRREYLKTILPDLIGRTPEDKDLDKFFEVKERLRAYTTPAEAEFSKGIMKLRNPELYKAIYGEEIEK